MLNIRLNFTIVCKSPCVSTGEDAIWSVSPFEISASPLFCKNLSWLNHRSPDYHLELKGEISSVLVHPPVCSFQLSSCTHHSWNSEVLLILTGNMQENKKANKLKETFSITVFYLSVSHQTTVEVSNL